MRVIIRADGNREIAMGHIMRCLSIADALRERGAEVTFVTAGRESEGLLRERGYMPFVLDVSYREMESELDRFSAYFRRDPGDLILVDSYYITQPYMEALGKFALTAWMDDLGETMFPADIVINYNLYGAEVPYQTLFQQAGLSVPGRCLLGCGYAPLRAGFGTGIRGRVRESVGDVLITTGGGDQYNGAGGLCGLLAEEMERGLHSGVRYHVVCGPFSGHKETLLRLAGQYPAFVIHENVTDMWNLMAECDIAVSAAGSTMYELCSMQLPAVCFYFAENQRRMAEYFGSRTDIVNGGDLSKDRETVLKRLSAGLSRLEQDGGLRERIRQQMGALTDGAGAGRIAEALLGAVMEKASL